MDACQSKRTWLGFIYLLVVLLSLIQYVDADCSITTPGVYTFGSECQYMCHCKNVILDADCSITTPGVYTFGSECQYMCHCKNNESCDTTTGECTSGCDRYWFGPGCQYRDLAENEFSRHASNLKNIPVKYANKGNDGDTSTCSYTKEAHLSDKIPWWRVVLENEVTITDIYILTTADGLQYFREFEVTVEKLPYADREVKTKPPDASVCYKHDNTIPDSTNIHVTCTTPLIGNQVRITLSEIQSQLIVCDFRINRGRNLAFRQSITSSTIYWNSNSYHQASNAVNGLVSNTDWSECFVTGNFSDKWLQVEFDRSIDVYYFNVTSLSGRYDCIRNYKIYDTTYNKELLHDSGSDRSPATHGYLNKSVQKIRIEKPTGNVMAICDIELSGDCPVNQCGYDCSKVCHCKSIKSLEDKISGICTSGCEDRWTGENGKCDVECARNIWGTSCQNECGACRQGTCDVVTGKCTGGCQDGYYNTDDDCKTECASGWYGYNCQSKCPEHCKNGCDKVNGKCINGCNPGYFGDKCEQECPDGTYGLNCSESCNSNCIDICDHVTGKCTQCIVGWQGDSCDQECPDGTHGANCTEPCTPRCLNACNKLTGECLHCKDGWTGNICETECPEGMYGPNCKHNCSQQCTDVCAKDNGFCNCTIGWYGDTCHDGCDSGFEGSLCSSKIVQPSDKGFPILAIAGMGSAVVVIVIIVVILCIVIKRCSGNKNHRFTESIDNTETGWKNDSDDQKKNGPDNVKIMLSFKHNDSVYDDSIGIFPKPDEMNEVYLQPTTSSFKTSTNNKTGDDYEFGNASVGNKSSTAIALNNLTDYVKSKIANVNFFDNEFQGIPYGLQHPTLDATKSCNKGKNRYKELFAYDHARVVLKTFPSEPKTDYINASYIKGYNKDRAYIAAQGPTENNVKEFWRMIWENNVDLIAMLTKLIEETKKKCIQYWAEKGKSKTFGQITVFTESEKELAEFTVRCLKITHGGKKEERIVMHYIFTAWQDKNIPHSTCSLLHFWQKVRKHDVNKTKPWLVHCSAGVRRTGTFIALDYLYDQGVDAGFIDVNVCVRQLRNQRVNMVQVKEQYRYLYRIMIEALNLPSTPILVHTFDAYYTDLLKEDPKTRQQKLKIEFETMSQTDCLVRDTATQEYVCKNAQLAVNKDKNRFSNILAPDEFRPFIRTHVPGTTDYINAIYLPSYSDMSSYIITQSPLPDTAVDCCRLIIDQYINVVVTFNDDGDNDVGIYLPCKGSIKLGPFEVTLNNEEVKHGYVIRRHTLKFKSWEHEVVQVVCQNWPTNKLVPEDPSTMLQILQDITDLQRHYENKPVLLQCLNGAERSGLCVVLLNIIERSRIEEEVSIVQVVRYLRSRRQQIVPNYEQYKFCHDVLLSYTGSKSTYANL